MYPNQPPPNPSSPYSGHQPSPGSYPPPQQPPPHYGSVPYQQQPSQYMQQPQGYMYAQPQQPQGYTYTQPQQPVPPQTIIFQTGGPPQQQQQQQMMFNPMKPQNYKKNTLGFICHILCTIANLLVLLFGMISFAADDHVLLGRYMRLDFISPAAIVLEIVTIGLELYTSIRAMFQRDFLMTNRRHRNLAPFYVAYALRWIQFIMFPMGSRGLGLVGMTMMAYGMGLKEDGRRGIFRCLFKPYRLDPMGMLPT